MKLFSLCILSAVLLAACGSAQKHIAKACYSIDANQNPKLAETFNYGRAVVPAFEEFAATNSLTTTGELPGGSQSFRDTTRGIYLSLVFGMGGQKASVTLFTDLPESDDVFGLLKDFMVNDIGQTYNVYSCSDDPEHVESTLFGVDLYAT